VTATNGDTLHAVWLAEPTDGTDPPVVLLHGFTQNACCWGSFGDALSSRHPTLAVDAPGHGGSTPVHADSSTGAELLAETIEVAGRSPVVLVGYSMGGRLGLHAALHRPDLVAALVLIGATAGIEDHVDRAARQAADDGLADHLLAIGLESFVDEWLAQPLFAHLDPQSACREERLANEPEGLASSLRLAGTGTQAPLWDQISALEMPVLVVAGSRDAKFRAIGKRMSETIGANATFEIIEGAGHAVHLERPDDTAEAIETWLAAVQP
jgi:2-succinyl-6-hydroxy-2,4-cyclohexadiene-1-carboxylate synthase